MRFFMTIMPSPDYEAGKPVPEKLMAAMGPFIEKSVQSGALISTAGLKRSQSGTRLRGDSGRVAIIDGPFTESKEVIGGYAVIELPSKADAIALATEFVNLHIDNGMPDIVVDVREIDGGYNF
jgi:hypothetical protein